VKKKSIILVVTDNGIGISEKALTSKKAFGLISMRERAKSLGGELKLSVHEDGGTEVTLLLPVKVRNNHESFDL
jgi:signal transduction histidine kinase